MNPMKSFEELPDGDAFERLWKQQPVRPPEPDLELRPDSWVGRGAEVIGWWLARLEHWLSESGWLRAWLRFCLWLSVALTAAALLLLPAVTKVLTEIATSSGLLAIIIGHVMTTIAALPPVLISLGCAYLAWVITKRLWLRRRARSYRQDDPWQ